MLELFAERIKKLGGEWIFVRKKEEALKVIKEFLGKRTIWWDQGFLSSKEKERLKEEFSSLSFEVELERAKEAEVGINEVDYGIVETGSLVEIADPPQKVLCSTLPEIHIALLSPTRLLFSLTDFFVRFDWRSGYFSFITGPSRTADIEGRLTLGVHGPARLIVICIEEWIK